MSWAQVLCGWETGTRLSHLSTGSWMTDVFTVVLLKTDPVLDPIRGEGRFQSLLPRVNLAET